MNRNGHRRRRSAHFELAGRPVLTGGAPALARLLGFVVLGALLITGPGARPAAAQLYAATPPGWGVLFDPGDLGPAADHFPYDGVSLNDAGLVAYSGRTKTLWYDRGLLWDGQTVVDQGWNVLGLIGEGGAFGINNHGTVAGYKYNNEIAHALLWDGTTTWDLNPLLGGQSSVAHGINDAGVVTGYTKIPGSPARYRAFICDGTTAHILGTLPGDTDSVAYGINGAGQVVGRSGSYPPGYSPLQDPAARARAVLFDSAGVHDLGALPGHDQSFAIGINDSGQMVGWSWSSAAGGSMHAFLYDGAGMHDLGTLGGTRSQARAINTAGQIVGGSEVAPDVPYSEGHYHACLWSHGSLVDLNNLLLDGPLGGGYELVVANGINNRGQIVCETPSQQSVLLTPVIVPIARLTPGRLVFGTQPAGTSSDAQSVTLTNTGQAPLHVGAVAVTGTHPADFAIVSDTGEATLAPGASRSMTVRFTPTAAGERDATLAVPSDTAPWQGMQQIGLSGVGTIPIVSLAPGSLSFGNQRVGTASADQSIVLTNTGQAPLVIHTVTITGSGASAFAAGDLAGVTLAPNESRTLAVHFTPTARGSQSATLSIDSNTPGSPAQVPLSGTGLAPVLRVSPTALDFDKEPVGLSGSLAVLLQNTGDAPLLVRGVSFTGPNAAEFSLASSLGSGETLQPGDLTLLNVRFSPAATGSRTASLLVDSDSTAAAPPVLLTGIGTEPLLRLSHDALIFAIQPAGGASEERAPGATQTLTLTNNGDAPLVIDGLALAGPDFASFHVVTDTGEKSLDPGASRTVVLSFSPATVGSAHRSARIATVPTASASYTATLTIGHNDPHPGSPHQVTLTAAAGPGAPTGLVATLMPANRVALAWNDNSSSETAVELYRKAGAGDYSRIALLAPHTTAYSDASAAVSTTYTYQVRAVNDYGSAASNPAGVTTQSPPAAPSGLRVIGFSYNKVSLAWADNSSNETAFEIYRKSGSGAYTLVGLAAPNTSFYQDTTVSPGTAYTYELRSANDVWASAFTNSVTVTTVVAPPAAPTGLRVIGFSYNKVSLAWTDNSSNETAFEIYRKNGSGAYVLVGLVAPNMTFYQDTTVSPTTTYTYQVRAANNLWASASTNPVNVTTVQAPPAAPSGLTATAVSSTQINLTWVQHTSSETALEIYRQTGGEAYTLLGVLPPGATSFADRSTAANTPYNYRVRAANNSWASAYTNVAGVQTP